jgi:hypothetical protein
MEWIGAEKSYQKAGRNHWVFLQLTHHQASQVDVDVQ